MVFIKRSEIIKMEKHIIDEETEMTEWDLFENNHCYEDIHVIEDVMEVA